MILVTGGLGFIGSHVALTLLAQGQEVVLVDNLANSNLQVLERLEYIANMYIPFVKVDVRNTPALNKVFEQYPIDTVIHAAGFKSLEESLQKPLEYYNDNVSCIMSLLRSMQRSGVRKLIHLSSMTVYGQSSLSLNEEMELNFNYPNPYVKSQQMIEEIIRDTFQTDNEWRIAILRLGNVAGAFEHGGLGEYIPPLPKNIIPLAMQVALGQREVIELRKSTETEDGSLERSFVHVIDVCRSIHASLYWLSTQQQHCCEVINIAGEVSSIRHVLSILAETTDQSIPVIDSEYYFNELPQIGSQSNKAKTLLGWTAQKSLKQMIEDQWRFYQNILSVKN